LKKRFIEQIEYADYVMLFSQMSIVGLRTDGILCHVQSPVVTYVTYGSSGSIVRYRAHWNPREYLGCINGAEVAKETEEVKEMEEVKVVEEKEEQEYL